MENYFTVEAHVTDFPGHSHVETIMTKRPGKSHDRWGCDFATKAEAYAAAEEFGRADRFEVLMWTWSNTANEYMICSKTNIEVRPRLGSRCAVEVA